MASFNMSFRDKRGFNLGFGEVQRVSSDDYNACYNKPRINGVELVGDKSSHDIKVQDEMNVATVAEIEAILYLDV